MPFRDILLPLVGEPSAAAIATIDKCMAMAGDIGAQVTALAVEGDILVRPKWVWGGMTKTVIGRPPCWVMMSR